MGAAYHPVIRAKLHCEDLQRAAESPLLTGRVIAKLAAEAFEHFFQVVYSK